MHLGLPLLLFLFFYFYLCCVCIQHTRELFFQYHSSMEERSTRSPKAAGVKKSRRGKASSLQDILDPEFTLASSIERINNERQAEDVEDNIERLLQQNETLSLQLEKNEKLMAKVIKKLHEERSMVTQKEEEINRLEIRMQDLCDIVYERDNTIKQWEESDKERDRLIIELQRQVLSLQKQIQGDTCTRETEKKGHTRKVSFSEDTATEENSQSKETTHHHHHQHHHRHHHHNNHHQQHRHRDFDDNDDGSHLENDNNDGSARQQRQWSRHSMNEHHHHEDSLNPLDITNTYLANVTLRPVPAPQKNIPLDISHLNISSDSCPIQILQA